MIKTPIPMELLFHGVGHYHPKSRRIGAAWLHHDIIVILKGTIALEIAGAPFELSEGNAVVIPPHHPFEGEAVSEEAMIWVLHFKDSSTTAKGSPFAADAPDGGKLIPNAVPELLDRLLLEEFTRRWMAAATEGSVPPKRRDLDLLGELLLRRFEEAFFRSRQEVPPRLRAVVEEVLQENLHYSVATMAQRAGVCPSRFRQLFTQYYGISPIEFLLRARMEKARQLLCETNTPIKEISRIVGYSELAAFHHAFVREVGLSPGTYRKRYKEVI